MANRVVHEGMITAGKMRDDCKASDGFEEILLFCQVKCGTGAWTLTNMKEIKAIKQ